MPKPALSGIAPFYHRYVGLVKADSVHDALKENTTVLFSFLEDIPESTWSYRYAEGKWSIREMVQHMVDTERIFAYRALCIARGEKQSLPGFDENQYANAAGGDRRGKDELLAEFKAVRTATEMLFASFDERQLEETGTANNAPVGVNAIGFITVGHVLHHLEMLRQRYLQED
jgi:uncharacterized damage-inducible protein DinB